jgi:hypothetical protein
MTSPQRKSLIPPVSGFLDIVLFFTAGGGGCCPAPLPALLQERLPVVSRIF